MNIWFTSDTHFGHANICRGVSTWEDKSNCRDFDTVEEHDAYLLEQLNKRLRPADQLWHLGDFGFGTGKSERFAGLREAIKCEDVRLLLGNHDHAFEDDRNNALRALFKRVKTLHYGKIGGRHMVLCHYAMRTWPWQHYGSIQLYGHSHGSLPDDPGLSLDVGIDTCLYGHEKYTPYSLDEILAIMEKKDVQTIDHHKKGVNP